MNLISVFYTSVVGIMRVKLKMTNQEHLFSVDHVTCLLLFKVRLFLMILEK